MSKRRNIPPEARTSGTPQVGPINPSALSLAVAAKVLGLPEDHLRRHADLGAPLNPDGTLNLVHYAAWLNQSGEEAAIDGN